MAHTIRPFWIVTLLGGLAIASSAIAQQVTQTQVDAPVTPGKAVSRIWRSQPPAGCPFEQSKALLGLSFTNRHVEYTGADTWYPSWAADGNLYSPWTDGNVNSMGCSSAGQEAHTGNAKIIGDDPMKLQVVEQGTFKSSPRPYEGRYPCGSLVYKNVWYYGTYCLHPSGGVRKDGIIYNWPWMGPFVGFRWSNDFGKNWTQTPCTPDKPLFGEHALKGEPVKFGAPHFVDFGKELEHSPDGKAYLAAQGASDGDNRRYGYNSWITADEIRIARVAPSIENMNDPTKYEFFAGDDDKGQPTWTSDLAKSKPTAAWKDNMGCVTITYDAPLKKYLMCVTDGGNTVHYFNTYILESDRVTGPWKLVTYMKHFGEQAYFVNFPSKFISADGKTLWLCYAANFASGWGGINLKSNPPGSRYAMCLQEVKLLDPLNPPPAPTVLDDPDNVALTAAVTASSTHGEYSVSGVNDGVVDGFPNDTSREWASNGERDTAILRLTWAQEQTVDRVWLFDRPNDPDQVQSGLLVFSDGSTIATGELPDDAKKGLEIKFPAKKIKWMAFFPTKVKGSTLNIGLAEIAVFRAK